MLSFEERKRLELLAREPMLTEEEVACEVLRISRTIPVRHPRTLRVEARRWDGKERRKVAREYADALN